MDAATHAQQNKEANKRWHQRDNYKGILEKEVSLIDVWTVINDLAPKLANIC